MVCVSLRKCSFNKANQIEGPYQTAYILDNNKLFVQVGGKEANLSLDLFYIFK